MRQPLTGAAGPPAEDGEQDPDVTAEAAEVQALAQHRTGRSGYVNIILYIAICVVLMSVTWRTGYAGYARVCGDDSCMKPSSQRSVFLTECSVATRSVHASCQPIVQV